MSTIILQLPAVGAKADVSELQFITALHQSGKQTRNDGSLAGMLNLFSCHIWFSLSEFIVTHNTPLIVDC